MRVGIYCRLSDEDRNKANPSQDSESIQNQKTMLIRHAMTQGWEIFDIYCDDDYTGSDRNRPDFRRLLEDAKRSKFDIILCKSQSRFSRELEIVEHYIHGLFLEWGIRFVGLVDNADTDVKGNKKSRQINGLVNEWYLEDLSENIRAVLDSKRREGKYLASFPLYGYLKSELDKNRLIIDETAAAVVHRIYRLFLDGHGIHAIAHLLDTEGVLNPTAYKRSLGMKVSMGSKGGTWRIWSPCMVRNILSNQMYVGDMVQGKLRKVSYKSTKLQRTPKETWTIVPNTHDPIIDRKDWILVQEMLTHRPKMQKDGRVHLFAGKVFCMVCSSPLHIGYTKRKTKVLRCPVRTLDSQKCRSSDVTYHILEEQVLAEFNELARAYYDETLLDQNVSNINTYNRDIEKVKAEIMLVQKRANELSSALLNLYIDKTKGIVSDEMYVAMYAKATQESEMLSKQQKALEAKLNALVEKNKNVKKKIDIIREYKQIDKLTRQIVLCFIERIEIGKRDPVTKQLPVHIQWTL